MKTAILILALMAASLAWAGEQEAYNSTQTVNSVSVGLVIAPGTEATVSAERGWVYFVSKIDAGTNVVPFVSVEGLRDRMLITATLAQYEQAMGLVTATTNIGKTRKALLLIAKTKLQAMGL